ncbi:MAG: lipoprotein of unknown function, partial [Burkholderiales bacterium]|nr:lipoprotein of unknown function [Burkholderiales bacterium]
GILGVGPLPSDENFGGYFTCDNTGCSFLDSPPAYVSNPIMHFSAGNNNGLTLTFASVPSTGATGADGYAIFGVGTNASNTPATSAAVKAFQIESSDFSMNISTVFNSNTYDSFLDTGSNFLFFSQQFFPDCGGENKGFFCPMNDTSELAQMIGTDGLNKASNANINFNIGNANGLFSSDNTAFSNVGATFEGLTGVIDWGLPFYLGRTVYMIFAGSTATINGITYPASPNGYWIY